MQDKEIKRPVTAVFPYLRFALDKGVDTGSVLKNTGLNEIDVFDPQNEILLSQELQIVRNLIHMLPVPEIGCQHPNISIDPAKIEFQKVFRTPIYDSVSSATLKELPSLNGKRNTYYCGSHFGYGLHEEAVTSAVQVGRLLGAKWE